MEAVGVYEAASELHTEWIVVKAICDWGDGSNGIVSRGSAGLTHLTHTYDKPGNYRGSYTVKITVTDAAGEQSFLQLLVVVNDRHPSTVGAIGQSGNSASRGTVLQVLRTYVWPGYGMVVLMLASFWLGERRELNVLRPHHKRTRHA